MTGASTCAYCGAPASCSRVCSDCMTGIVAEERESQGLPPTVEDPVVLERLAALGRFSGSVAS